MKKKISNPNTTYEIMKHTPSPVLNALRECKPQTVTPLKFKKKYKDSYKKELRQYY